MTEPIAVDAPKPAFSRSAPVGLSTPVAPAAPAPKAEPPKIDQSKLEAVLTALAPSAPAAPAPAPNAPSAEVPIFAGFTARHLKVGAIALASIVAGVGTVRMLFPGKDTPPAIQPVAALIPPEAPSVPPPKVNLEPSAPPAFDNTGGVMIPPAPLPLTPPTAPARPVPTAVTPLVPDVAPPSGGLLIPEPPKYPGAGGPVAPPSLEPLLPSPGPLIPVGATEPPKLPIPTAPGGPTIPAPPAGTGGPAVPALPALPAAPGGMGAPLIPPVAPPTDLVPPVAPPTGLVPPVAPPTGMGAPLAPPTGLVPPVAPPTGMGAPLVPPTGGGGAPLIPPIPPAGTGTTAPKPAPIDPPAVLPMVPGPKVEPPSFAPIGSPPAGGLGTPAGFTKPGGSTDARPLVPELAPRTSFDVELYEPRKDDSYDSISKDFYNDARFAKALEAFNRARSPNGVRTVEVPPLHVLRKQFPQLMGGAVAPVISPASGTGGTGNTGGTGGTFPPPPAAGSDGVWGRVGEPPAPATPVRSNTYRVPAGGMTPREIARSVLGSEQKWRDLYDLNGGILPDSVLPAGTEVKLP